jgi:protoporphyrinogen oxidase
MRKEKIHTLLLGAGPSGLAAGYTLAKAGAKPVVLERDKVCGGLMRSFKRGDFIVDIGRKELYNRLEKVDAFWSALLGPDYRTYPHRGGVLYGQHLIDMSPAYRGLRRGMPLSMFVTCCGEFVWSRIKSGPSPRNLEEYWYQQRGKTLTRVANQGFQEKLVGKKWKDIQITPGANGAAGPGLVTTLKQAAARFFSKKETNTFGGIWRHPARGTGQICELLEKGIRGHGGTVYTEAKIISMASSDGRVTGVTAEVNGEVIEFEPQHVVSSVPAEYIRTMLLPSKEGQDAPQKPTGQRRVAVLVYMFLNESPRFPHFWLQVTCPNTRIGRVANYAALNADMVPPGKSAICCEIYCYGDDPILKMSDAEVTEMALNDLHKAALIDKGKCFDTMVMKFPGADASQNRHNWFSKERQALFAELRKFENLYSVNRTDLDIATLAGIEAAEAILSGDRSTFERHFDPTQLGIRSEGKPFEFRLPPGVQA